MTALNQVLLLWRVLIWQDHFPLLSRKGSVEEGGASMLILDLYPFCTPPEMSAPLKQVNFFLSFCFAFVCLFFLRRWFSLLKTLQINLKVMKVKQKSLFFPAL